MKDDRRPSIKEQTQGVHAMPPAQDRRPGTFLVYMKVEQRQPVWKLWWCQGRYQEAYHGEIWEVYCLAYLLVLCAFLTRVKAGSGRDLGLRPKSCRVHMQSMCSKSIDPFVVYVVLNIDWVLFVFLVYSKFKAGHLVIIIWVILSIGE